jgi:hypothetical protein
VLAPFAHPLFTAMTGIGVGLAVSHPSGTIRWAAPVLGYALAVGLHALWNSSLTFGFAGYLAVYFVVMVPIFLATVLWARNQRRRERDIVARQLPAMVYYRWITPLEAGWLADIAARRSWRKAVAAVRTIRGAAAGRLSDPRHRAGVPTRPGRPRCRSGRCLLPAGRVGRAAVP